MEEEARLEQEALQSIYENDFEVDHNDVNKCRVHLSRQSPVIAVLISMVEGYPTHNPPLFEIKAPSIPQDKLRPLEQALMDCCEQNTGMPVVYMLVELLREQLTMIGLFESDGMVSTALDEQLQLEEEGRELAAEQERRGYVGSDGGSGGGGGSGDQEEGAVEQGRDGGEGEFSHLRFIHGEPFRDRKSTFQAHLVAVTNEREVRYAVSKLKENNKIARATHNILAYRCYDPGRGIQVHDNDDDGETAAGARLAEMMSIMQVQDVLIVVSRWFGGTLLGPDRFKHINNVARELLEENGYLRADNNNAQRSSAGKKGNKQSTARQKKG